MRASCRLTAHLVARLGCLLPPQFISSKEACQIVAKESASASKACASLVQAAAQRWKKAEGNYRDDITAIVVRLP